MLYATRVIMSMRISNYQEQDLLVSSLNIKNAQLQAVFKRYVQDITLKCHKLGRFTLLCNVNDVCCFYHIFWAFTTYDYKSIKYKHKIDKYKRRDKIHILSWYMFYFFIILLYLFILRIGLTGREYQTAILYNYIKYIICIFIQYHTNLVVSYHLFS